VWRFAKEGVTLPEKEVAFQPQPVTRTESLALRPCPSSLHFDRTCRHNRDRWSVRFRSKLSHEQDGVNLLAMMQPTVEGVNQVEETAAARWQHHLVRAEQERRQWSTRLSEQHALNKQTIEARVKGKI
jgi:hypothetical protein